MKVAVLGGGSGGAAAVAELVGAGHEVRFWSRSSHTLAAFRDRGGIAYDGVLGEGIARPELMTDDLARAIGATDTILVCTPTLAHGEIARNIASIGSTVPIVLNPGHTGGAFEVRQAFLAGGHRPPPIAEFSTLTYVARKCVPSQVTITGRAKRVRLAALPGGEQASECAVSLLSCARPVSNVLACDLANVNMVLHAPGAILAAAWVEATKGDFTFYVQAMTPGVSRIMRALDNERRAVARAYDHELPSLTEEMQAIGTVEASVRDIDDFAAAISSGVANRLIKAPDSLQHRYYLEDFGHGLLPFSVLASIAGVSVPTASSLLEIGKTLIGADFVATGRTAERMGIVGMDRKHLLDSVGT